MLGALGFIHALLLRWCFWILKQPFQALKSTIEAMLALAGENVQRALSIVVSGLFIYLLAKGVLAFPHPPKPVLWTVALMAALWFYAFLRAAHYIANNTLVGVRQRRAFRQLSADVNKIGSRVGGRVTDGLARATEGTPLGRAFGSNREKSAKAEARAEAAARQAEADRLAREADDARRDELADLEPDPYAHRR